MNRSLLRAILALGVVITMLSGLGVFATFSDSADAGPQTVDSDQLAKAADLQLAVGAPDETSGGVTCGDYSDDLTSGASSTGAKPSADPIQVSWFCVKNAGSATVELKVGLTGVIDSDLACTGDEAVVDTTCGAGQAGELSPNLRWLGAVVGCSDRSTIGQFGPSSAAALATPIAITGVGPLAPGDVMCFTANVFYPTDTPLDAVLAAQSDEATWTYRFSASAGSPPPAAPTGVSAVQGDSQSTLDWTVGANTVSFTILEAGTSGGPYSEVIAGLPANPEGTDQQFVVVPTMNGLPYYFVVRAVGADGQTADSAEAYAAPLPPAP